jgi:hypothetical protein
VHQRESISSSRRADQSSRARSLPNFFLLLMTGTGILPLLSASGRCRAGCSSCFDVPGILHDTIIRSV